MINKDICSGCSACINICPVNAIELKEDELTGFKLAEIDTNKCINCNKCDDVCPHNTFKLHDSNNQCRYGFKYDDVNILNASSSGGAFTFLTKSLLDSGWKVVGVKWDDNFYAVYTIAETEEEYNKIRRSKYMQADLGDIFPRVKMMLDNGEKVVFTGVPCHVSGLLNYLNTDYKNLITIDLLCGALHSPRIWDKWYEYEGLDKSTFTDINMRYKCNNGAGNHTIRIEKNNGQVHNIMASTTPIAGLTFNGRKMSLNVCHQCKYRPLDRVSDFTISDMHNAKIIMSGLFDPRNNNVSSILCNTDKANRLFNKLSKKNNNVLYKKTNNIVKMPNNFDKRDLSTLFTKLNKYGISGVINTNIDSAPRPYDIAICGGTFNNNFGATITYYALYRYLELEGYKVIILPPNDTPFKLGMGNGNIFETSCNIAPNYFNGKHTDFNKLANIFILGSDQMWNKNCALYKEIKGLKGFLSYVNYNKNKIAYSTSFGSTEFFDDTDNNKDEIIRLLKRFNAISCREPSGIDLIKTYTDKEAQHTIDPVFLLNNSEYDKIISKSKITIPGNDYAVYYILTPNKPTLQFFHELTNITKCSEILIGDGQFTNIPKYKKLHPKEKFVNPILVEDWLKYIKNAKYVVTNSFHCICFCIIFNIPFICLRDINNVRIDWILSSTGLRDNYLKLLNINKAIEIIKRPINVLSKLTNFIDYSKNWLKEKITSY